MVHSAAALRTSFYRNALVGAFGWIVGALILHAGLAESLLLVGPLVAVPLGLALVLPQKPDPAAIVVLHILRRVQLPAALTLLGAFGLPAGDAAAILSTPWFLVTALVALVGLLRLARRGPLPISELSIDAGLAFLTVGGAWTSFSRWGSPFLGFTEPLVLLTAAHFHFAGFVLPILTGLAGRMLRTRFATAASIGVILGVPFTATGITLSCQLGLKWIELLATTWMVAAAMLVIALEIQLAIRYAGSAPGALWALSGVSLLAGMALAGTYAFGRFLGEEWLDIHTMVGLHATANVAGFALPGLWACTLHTAAIGNQISEKSDPKHCR